MANETIHSDVRAGATVDAAEVDRFSRLAGEWWNAHGKMAVLHKFNPVRVAYICEQVARQYGRDPKAPDCLKGLRILDLGCGGGILCESLARLGGTVVGAVDVMGAGGVASTTIASSPLAGLVTPSSFCFAVV